VEGEASQSVMRWEDYTQTAMDPVDDCTIWYVGDYIKADAGRAFQARPGDPERVALQATYSTRIGSLRLPGCR